MASEKQIAANRANAIRSTGPRSAMGKLNSSGNAYRHGLSCPSRFDRAPSAKVEALTRLLADEGTSQQFAAAGGVRRSAARTVTDSRGWREINEKIDLDLCDTKELRRMAALDRYERLARPVGDGRLTS